MGGIEAGRPVSLPRRGQAVSVKRQLSVRSLSNEMIMRERERQREREREIKPNRRRAAWIGSMEPAKDRDKFVLPILCACLCVLLS
mmetsp:Transcript_13856/g.27624  ORF Transcript_13856/g.27624 Transcript_13856/m.27624 type:complete len:86 (-) Transcript_13856:1432-1689(-)